MEINIIEIKTKNRKYGSKKNENCHLIRFPIILSTDFLRLFLGSKYCYYKPVDCLIERKPRYYFNLISRKLSKNSIIPFYGKMFQRWFD